jgi:hypothetical protein
VKKPLTKRPEPTKKRAIPELARPAVVDAFMDSVQRVILHYAEQGRPVKVGIPGMDRPQLVLFDRRGRIKQFLGSTIEEAMQINPAAANRLLTAGERALAKRTAVTNSARALQRKKPFTEQQMLRAGLSAFWNLAKRWQLSTAEQCALLAVSTRTRARWNARPPMKNAIVRDRLTVILLTYRRLVELTGGSDAETAMILRQFGSAENVEFPMQSIIEALCDPSVLAMDRMLSRLVSLIHAS